VSKSEHVQALLNRSPNVKLALKQVGTLTADVCGWHLLPFMDTTPPTEVVNLTADQQQAIAEFELARLRKQDRLNREARTYAGRRWLSLVVFALALWVAGRNAEFPYVLVVWLLALVFGVLHVHIHGINRRLDALLEMLHANANPVTKKEDADK